MKKGSFGSISGRSFGAFAASSQNGSHSPFGGVLSGQSTGAEGSDNGKKKELDHAIDVVEAKVKEAQVKVARECISLLHCGRGFIQHHSLRLCVDVTGEEEEDVEEEIKGVKLFVKRGNKPFASGMVGHLKLLVDRKTGKERLRASITPLIACDLSLTRDFCQCSDANLSGKCR